MTTRILLIDDDIELTTLLSSFLVRDGFEVEVVHDGERGLTRALTQEHGVVLLDVMLPKRDGLDVLRALRAAGSRVPVVMLTARGEDVDRIIGLELGADDYLPKPFNSRELVARIRAVQRRSSPSTSSEVLNVGDLTLNVGARIVRRGGQELTLTAIEFSLLEQLLRSAGRPIDRHTIAEVVLGRPLSPFERSIDVHVSNLRKKLGVRPDGRDRIQTIRGTGYVYATDEVTR